MNLFATASAAAGAVNPATLCTLRTSTGYTIGPDGTQAPTYATVAGVSAQVQSLSYNDIRHLAGLNIQGVRNAIYVTGDVEGLNRAALKGGDLFTFPDGTIWLVAMVLENWPGWTKVAVTQQNGA